MGSDVSWSQSHYEETVYDTHLIELRRMKGSFYLGATIRILVSI